MYVSKAAFFFVIALAATTVSAQVHRCKDATGKQVFSDRPCAAGQTGELVQRERTQDEILQEREQAFNAEVRKQDKRLAEQDREWAEQQRRALQPQPAPVVRHPGNDWQMRNDLRNADVTSGSIMNNGGKWDRRAEAERREEARRKALANPPVNITNCNGGFCNDDRGNVYTRQGGFLHRADGRTCTLLGNLANCN